MRLVFAGTPEPAVPSLRALLDSHHEVVAVVTRPDARVGRGRKLHRSPVGQLADAEGIRLLQPASARDPQFRADLIDLAPHACPVVAYGALLPGSVLDVPENGWINLHFSLLPAWRGAAPVQAAILHGDDVTGASTFIIEESLDSGPILGVVTESVGATDTSGDLLQRLSVSGAELLVATMDGVEDGSLVAVPQPSDGITLAPKITVPDARIDWNLPAIAIDRKVRACDPAPGAWTLLDGQRVKVWGVAPPAGEAPESLRAGELAPVGKNAWVVGTGTSALGIVRVQPPGKRRMAAPDWLRGLRLRPGAAFQ